MNHRVSSQEAILDKTMEIALAEGVDKVSIRKIASSCNIAIGSVYNYYANKDAVIAAAAERFWNNALCDQEKLVRPGVGFTMFLEQYYNFLYGRLASQDKSWLMEMSGRSSEKTSLTMLRQVLQADPRVNRSIWNMELNEDAFCRYVLTNLMALLRAGESNCRFFLFLLERFLYE